MTRTALLITLLLALPWVAQAKDQTSFNQFMAALDVARNNSTGQTQLDVLAVQDQLKSGKLSLEIPTLRYKAAVGAEALITLDAKSLGITLGSRSVSFKRGLNGKLITRSNTQGLFHRSAYTYWTSAGKVMPYILGKVNWKLSPHPLVRPTRRH